MNKKNAELDESEEIEEEDDSSHDRTDQTDITDVDEEERVNENASLVDKLKSKIKSLQKKSSKKDDEDEDDDKKAPAKNNRRTLIIGVIVVGLVVLLFGEEFFPAEKPATETASSFKKPNRKKPVNNDTPAAPTEETPGVDGTVATETPSTSDETLPVDTPVETVTTDTTIETTPESPVDVTSIETTPSEPDTTSEFTIEEPAVSTETITTTPETSFDTVDGETATNTDDNLTDQILQDLEKQAKGTQKPSEKKTYVAPPDYEYRGRGLVYNCTGQHWACVDAPSYKLCEDNSSSTKYLKKKAECYPFNIYDSQKGCENMQNRMVSSSAKTEFCKD